MNKRGVGVRNRLSGILVGIGIITSLVFAFINFNSAHAETTLSVSTPEDPILEVSLSSNLVQLDLAPTGGTAFSSANLTVTAGTNNIYGYELYMEVNSPNLTRTEPLANNTTPTINSLAENAQGYTEANFTTNSWGYKIDGDNYLAIPLGSTLLDSSEGPVNANSTTITFASKVNMEQAAGSYSTDIILRAITTTPPVTMQDIDTWRGSLAEGDTLSAQDIRDEQYYTVGKLADGRIWMLDNLAIDLIDTNVQANLTPETTNASDTAINALLHGGRAGGEQYATSGVVSNTGYDFSIPDIYLGSKDIVPANPPSSGYGSNKVGGWYNYCAATAGTYCYGSSGLSDAGNPSGNATEDICPAGWRLPTGGNNGEFKSLYNAHNNGYGEFRSALSAPLAGYFGSRVGDEGYFWSSTFLSAKEMYDAMFNTTTIDAQYSNWRVNGMSVRCIDSGAASVVTFDANGGTGTMLPQKIRGSGTLRKNTFTREGYMFTGWNTQADGSGVSYMDGGFYDGVSTTLYAQWADSSLLNYIQNITKTNCPTNVFVAQDIRDGTSYHVQKLADGNCWMLDNLAIDLTNDAVKSNLSESNTNAANISINYLVNGGGTGNYATSGVSSNWVNSESAPIIYTGEMNSTPSDAPTGGQGYDKTGIFYNFCAASAGSYCYSSSNNLSEDICPAGWRIPVTDTQHNEYQILSETYGGSASIFRSTLSITAAGWFYSGSLHNFGTVGYYWSGTSLGTYQDTIEVRPSRITFSAQSARAAGNLIRCIAK